MVRNRHKTAKQLRASAERIASGYGHARFLAGPESESLEALGVLHRGDVVCFTRYFANEELARTERVMACLLGAEIVCDEGRAAYQTLNATGK